MIYAVTIHIDKEVEKKWVRWMQDQHIPDVLGTKLFLGCRMMRSELTHKEGYTTYRMQYVLQSKDTYREYEEKYADEMRGQADKFFEGKYLAERDLLEMIRER